LRAEEEAVRHRAVERTTMDQRLADTEAPLKRARNSAKTKADILVAGRAEFAERGFEGARVDAIATLAGANKRLLYHYFGNKEDLYRAVLRDAYEEIRRG